MKDITKRADSFSRHLSQLKHFYTNTPFFQKGLFSGLTFSAFALMGVLPVIPQMEPVVSAAQEVSQNTEKKSDASALERCYWQEDVRLFTTLQASDGAAPATDIPCEEKALPVAAPVKKSVQTGEPAAHTDVSLQTTIQEMTVGYPIEVMAPAIAKYDAEVAGLIVGIGKKESNWGKRVPRDAAGADCFNYWGYKGAGTRGVAMGHGCFGTPEEAVSVIGNRLKELVTLRKTSAPANMIVWKCGSSCAGHDPASVQKWIADVALYYNRIALK